ncbi:outer membrane beta-barrel protein [Reichenbachiella sp. MALMAid0571]|uniref:outer membrane beta-barrel protein n=1 Tax=Reichenbachiella sp. MALMAid0571 TaxID=3143939 RepID=UPI0032DF8660
MRTIILLMLMVLISTVTFSQRQKINFNLSIGPTISIPKTSKLIINSNVDGAPEIISSINVGGFILPNLQYNLGERTSFELGLGFYLDRSNIEDRIGVVTNKGKRIISQIQIPFNFNYHFGNDNSYSIGIGAFTSLIVSAKEKGETLSRFSTISINSPDDPIISNDLVAEYNIEQKSYNSTNFGAFIQLRRNIAFTDSTNGFILLKINQYLNAIKGNDSEVQIGNNLVYNDEKEPTMLNIGIGLIL